MMTKLTMEAVVDVCRDLGVNAQAGPEGVDLPLRLVGGPFLPPAIERWRIRSGSGIAGRSYSWSLVRLTTPSGEHVESIGPLTTRRALATAIREWCAGPRPQNRLGYRLVAICTGQDGYGWVERGIRCDCGHMPYDHGYVGDDIGSECESCSCSRYCEWNASTERLEERS